MEKDLEVEMVAADLASARQADVHPNMRVDLLDPGPPGW